MSRPSENLPQLPPSSSHRRTFLGRIAAAGGAVFFPKSGGQPKAMAREDRASLGLIGAENRKLGALDWQLTRIRADRGQHRTPWIDGYWSKQSVRPVESIDHMVSTDPPRRFRAEIFRMGYYGGRGARLMRTLGPFDGRAELVASPGPKDIHECRWDPVTNIMISRGGPYGGDHAYAIVRVRDHGPFPERGPDEGNLLGARNVELVNGGGDWVVVKPGHWIFEGTGMKAGDRIPGLVGWEYHGDPANLPGLEVVAAGTAWVGGEAPQRWAATLYPGPKWNFVLNASTIFWAQGLSSPRGTPFPGLMVHGRMAPTDASSGSRRIS